MTIKQDKTICAENFVRFCTSSSQPYFIPAYFFYVQAVDDQNKYQVLE